MSRGGPTEVPGEDLEKKDGCDPIDTALLVTRLKRWLMAGSEMKARSNGRRVDEGRCETEQCGWDQDVSR
jgi:hypothetical protein